MKNKLYTAIKNRAHHSTIRNLAQDALRMTAITKDEFKMVMAFVA